MNKFFKDLAEVLSEKSPAILTAMAVTGVVVTVALTIKASFDSAPVIQKHEEENGVEEKPVKRFTTRAKLTWPKYIPAAAVAGVTIGCIFGANTISTKRILALTTVYTMTDRAFSEYKDKVVEQLGSSKDQKVVDALAQDRMTKDPVSSHEVIVTGKGDILCYDSMSGRYFQSDMETLRKAQNDINQKVLHDMYASQNEFYRRIGLPAIDFGEEVGWISSDLLELQFSTQLSEDDRPCIVIEYLHQPVREYYKFG